MEMNILFLISVAVISVSGQFLETEYRVDSVPLPVRRRINSAQYEIQPSIGREIEFSPERVSNQGRRHIENNQRANIQNGHINRNVDSYLNSYEAENRNYDTRPADRRAHKNGSQQEFGENQLTARAQEQSQENYDREANVQHNIRHNQNHRNNEDTNLKTNLDNTQNNFHQGNLHNQPNYSSNHNVRISENTNQQNHGIYEDGSQSELKTNTNGRNVDRNSQNQNYQQNHASNDNLRTNENPSNQQAQIDRTNYNYENVNNNRRAEASQRAIDSNSRGQQNIDSANIRNYNTKPSRQHTDNRRENDYRNYESSRQTTEPTRITIDDKSVTGETKSTEDNELASKSHHEGRMGNNNDDKWIWSSDGGKPTKTTIIPTNPTVDDRAAFSGDKCPTGQVRFNNMCVDVD